VTNERTRLRGERGFTLVELLVAIVILGIVTVPISNFFIGYLKNTAQTAGNLNESHDGQIASAYWQQDVSSVGVHDAYDSNSKTFPLQPSVNVGTYPCVSSVPNTTQIISMVWDQLDAAGAPGQTRVSYATRSANGENQLVRLQCSGSGTVDKDTVISHLVSGSVAVTCFSAGHVQMPACSGTPLEMDMAFSVRDPSGDTSYPITLVGQRRQT
jgi:prepilin-type N-terminal cleavage/methylation domain-containing protein